MAATVRATATFVTWDADERGNVAEVTVSAGQELPADHPIVEGHRELFEPAKPPRGGKRT